MGSRRPAAKTDPLTEMAWFALRDFVDPLDCNRRTETGLPLPLNTSRELEQVLNRETDEDGARLMPRPFTKSALGMHLRGLDTYYYRSKRYQPPRSGYGQSDRKALAHPGAEKLGIRGRCRRRSDLTAVLLGWDVDCHNGEDDGAEVRDLILSCFPSSYYERSTSGTGWHVFTKLALPVKYRSPSGLVSTRRLSETLDLLRDWSQRLADRLERERVERGYEAVIDRARGLPTRMRWDSRRGRIRIDCRSVCIKVPRLSSEDHVLRFVGAPFFCLSRLEQLLRSYGEADMLSALRRRKDAANPNPLVELLAREDPSDAAAGERQQEQAGTGHKSVSPGGNHPHDLLASPCALERSLGLCRVLARERGAVPDPATAQRVYEERGLATEPETPRRRRRFEQVCQHVAATFDASKIGPSWAEYDQQRAELLSVIRHAPPTDRTYRKNGRASAVTDEELAQAYYLFLCSARAEGDGVTEYGTRWMCRNLKRLNGRGASKEKGAAIRRILTEMGLIHRTRTYCPGRWSTHWRVIEPDEAALL